MLRALASLIAAALLLSACTGSDAVDQNGVSTYQFKGATQLGKLIPATNRKPAADFDAKLLSGGGTFKLASTRGKAVVLNFWGSWCTPCRTELPQFDLLYRKVMKARGVTFLGVDSKDDAGAGRDFVRTNDISFPSVYDEPGRVPVRLGHLPATSLPFTVLIDPKGRVAAVYALQVSYKDLEGALDRLLAER